MERNEPMFDGPVPGMSLTKELGNRPWQQPSQYSSVEEALPFYIERLVDPRFAGDYISVIEAGMPLAHIADTLQIGAVMNGVHSIDTGILITPIVIELLITLSEQAGIDYNIGFEEDDLDASKVYSRAAIEEAKRIIEDAPEEPSEVMEEPEENVKEDTGQGLMSRRSE